MKQLLMAVVLIVAGLGWTESRGAEIRYSDVIYLDEVNLPPLQLKALARVPLMFSRDNSSIIGHIAPGQTVTVLGVGASQYYVNVRIATGQARGWLRLDALEPPAPEVLADLKRRRERAVKHKELIARHEVIIGMTRDEVRASLGKPDKIARTVTADGEAEQWSYVTYRYLPQYNYFYDARGQLQQNVVYQRVPTGHKIVVFRNNEVAVIEDHTQERTPPPITTVVPPLIVP
jgi:hypothetical protein